MTALLKIYAVAIDGPVAAGKGTIAALLAKKLHGFHFYTGAMYRCVALYCQEHNISFQDRHAILKGIQSVNIQFKNNRIYLNGKDVTEAIKAHDISEGSSQISVFSQVREEIVKRQQAIGFEKMEEGFVVIADGRDAATKIFPNAAFKIFLTASSEIRAKRRYEQMGGEGNTIITYNQILEDTKKRDFRDTNRAIDPLVKDPKKYGYIVIDNSNLSQEQTVERLLEVIHT